MVEQTPIQEKKVKKKLLHDLLEHIEVNDPGCPFLSQLRKLVEAPPAAWHDPTTRKFATSPTSFPQAAKIYPLYRMD